MDGDGVNPHPMYYLSGTVQSAAGSITGSWYLDGPSTSAGSAILALRVSFSGAPTPTVPTNLRIK